jgi:glucose uptake protein GlcU
MKQNIGTLDRIVRLSAALLVAVLYFTHQISGTIAIILGVVAVILLITGFVRFCPLYFPLGINTNKK